MQTVFTDFKLEKVESILLEVDSIGIITHKSPDGDAIGSSLGLLHALGGDFDVDVFLPDALPPFLNWLPGIEKVHDFSLEPEKKLNLLNSKDLIFFLDFNALNRIGSMDEITKGLEVPKIMIDHHEDPEEIANISFSDPMASSTCEMVFEFLESLGKKNLINKNSAQCLYTGIMTDTGSFRFSCTTKRTHEITSFLIEQGAENSNIHDLVYNNYSINRLQLLGFVLKDKLKIIKNLNTGYFALSQGEMKRFYAQKGDTEGMVNYPLTIKKVKFSVFFKEDGGRIKISFRSKGDFSASNFAQKHFGGGGHHNAAGGVSFESLEKTVNKFINLLPQYKEQLRIGK